MRIPRQDPLEGPKAVASWSTVKLKGGQGVNLWMIGDSLWFWSHWVNGRTLPCYWEFSQKALACPHCKPGIRAYWQGYTPCRSDSGQKLIATPKADNKPIIDAIRPGRPVWVARAESKNAPMTVVEKKGGTPTTVDARDLAALDDIESALVQMWKDAVLREWFDSRPQLPSEVKQAMDAAAHAKRDHQQKNDEFTAAVKAALVVKRASDNAVTIGDAMPPVVSNGQHKRK